MSMNPLPRKSHLSGARLALALVLLALVAALLAAGPAAAQVEPTAEPGAAVLTPTPSPIPQEWVDNVDQTLGIIAGAVILTVIIIGGTLHTIAQNRDPSQK